MGLEAATKEYLNWQSLHIPYLRAEGDPHPRMYVLAMKFTTINHKRQFFMVIGLFRIEVEKSCNTRHGARGTGGFTLRAEPLD
ncbi:hypothetical protein J6590_076870 [Homalodisca vitripennis]|nr:hypothetical protein J6590_076870 [Homalodisca vitripennis]